MNNSKDQSSLSKWGSKTDGTKKRGELYSERPKNKDELISRLKELKNKGWIQTREQFNDGLVGNTLEDFLGIEENNISLPDTGNYEIKAQRMKTSSLTTLFHYDPYPRKPKSVVAHTLGPKYGWPHKEKDEWSFRITMYGNSYTNRGFKIVVVESSGELRVKFNPDKVDSSKKGWLSKVLQRAGPNIKPQPYWKLEQIRRRAEKKIPNLIYVHAKHRKREKFEEFKYDECILYEGFNWKKFKEGLSNGGVFVDFDARAGHNHGTKFRVRQGTLLEFFETKEKIF